MISASRPASATACRRGTVCQLLFSGLLAASSLILAGGCREKEPEIEILSLKGSVEKVEARPDGTGKITVWYFSEKQGQEVLGAGDVTAQTEIMINGAVATLADIRVGDRVRGEVRLEKTPGERKLTALKIIVDRATPVAPATGG